MDLKLIHLRSASERSPSTTPFSGRLTITQLPSWVHPPFSYTPGAYSSLVVAFEDPDRLLTSGIVASKWLYLFGTQATIKRWKQKPRPQWKNTFLGKPTPSGGVVAAAPAGSNAEASSSKKQLTPAPRSSHKREQQVSHVLSVLSQISVETQHLEGK